MSLYKLSPLKLHENARCAKCGECEEFEILLTYNFVHGERNVDSVFCYQCDDECELTVDHPCLEGETMETEDGFNTPLQFTNEQERVFLEAVDESLKHVPQLLKAHSSFLTRFDIFDHKFLRHFRDILLIEAKLPPFDVHAMEQMVARGYPTVKQGKLEYYKLLKLKIEHRWHNAMKIQRVWRGHNARWKVPCFTWKDEDEHKPKKARYNKAASIIHRSVCAYNCTVR